MQLFTFAQLKTKLGNDYDITDEVWVDDDELAGYINDAIDDSETAIHTMSSEDKYFLTSTPLVITSGTTDLVYPSDIYANKIRKIFYLNGSIHYEIEKMRRIENTVILGDPNYGNGRYQYLPVNDSVNKSPRMRLYPTPLETGTLGIIWYIRNMFRVTTDLNDATNVCEVPECVNFVTQHVKYNLAKKSRNPQMIAAEKSDRDAQYALMLEALKDMTIDENNLMQMDLTDYDYGDPRDLWR